MVRRGSGVRVPSSASDRRCVAPDGRLLPVRVLAGPAAEAVLAGATLELVVAGAALELVCAAATGQGVATGAAGQTVLAVATGQLVVARAAREGVVAGAAGEAVLAAIAVELVPARAATHLVVARAGADDVIAASALDRVVAAKGDDHVGVPGPGELVLPVRADDGGLLVPATRNGAPAWARAGRGDVRVAQQARHEDVVAGGPAAEAVAGENDLAVGLERDGGGQRVRPQADRLLPAVAERGVQDAARL